MCLDAHAHGVRVDHEIFRTPNEVAPTLEERETPADYLKGSRVFEGLGATMAMWRVQTEGYLDGEGQLVGLVSNNSGFLDSPDAEWIASGVNTKAPDAVAIGRHGNLFHWGFAASPTYMTEEAKLVLVNALHYIARFDGRAPIAHKRRGVITRSDLRAQMEAISDSSYARLVARYAHLAEQDAARKAQIRARIEAGEEVGEDDRRSLGSSPPEPPGRFKRLRRLFADEFWPDELGEDADAIAAYLTENLPYFRSGGWYELQIDEELKRFGRANDDPAMLEDAVHALVAGRDPELARTLLERYTEESFGTPEEWSVWLEANRERLFFTEAGGYVWLVNEPRSPRARPTGARGARAPEPGPGEPFTAALAAEPLGDGRWSLTVAVRVLDGWHAYDRAPADTPYVPIALELELPPGVELDGEWDRPPSHADLANPQITLFEGQLEFTCELEAAALGDTGEVRCTLRYQVCDEDMCLPPASLTLTTPLSPVPDVVDRPSTTSPRTEVKR